ncbi:MAG TPA: glycosyltransferase [Candidatus Saccharimonadales bacterium]|nr:glycosyltransferase [Candidatus Saccharimonadales bacterium]
MKVAIVCDWLTNMGGAEKTVLALHDAFPDAPIYTSVFDKKACPEFVGLDVRTTYLQNLPAKVRAKHQLFPTFRTNAFRSLDLSEFDVVISSASAEAKAVKVRPDAIHICYCHTPTRYYWSHYNEYLAEPGLGPLNPAVRVAMPALVHFMRQADLRAVNGVDYFIANSNEVKKRIKQYYNRDSTVIHPPVDLHRFSKVKTNNARTGFVVVGRQVPYKRTDLAIQACNKLKLPLTIYGDGPEHERLVKLAGPTIKFVVGASDKAVVEALAKAKAFIMPQVEDFGIVQIEAMAAGTPVIAFGQGGSLDTVSDKTGVLFSKQTVDSLAKAIEQFQAKKFDHAAIQSSASGFSSERFVQEIRDFVRSHRSKSASRNPDSV